MPHEVFICYATHNKAVAEAICAALESRHIKCWIAPRDVLPGTEWAETIVDALDESRVLVLVLSSSSNTSPQVIREVGRAASNGIPIMSIRIDDVVPSKAMDYFISSHQWLDAQKGPLKKYFQRLADTVQQILARKHVPQAVTEITEAEERARKEAEKAAEEREKREIREGEEEARKAREAEKRPPKAPLVIKTEKIGEKKRYKEKPVKLKISRWRNLTKKQMVGIIVSPIIIAISIFLIINLMIDNSGINEEKLENNELVEKVEEELAEEETLAEEAVAEEVDPASFVGEINLWSHNIEFDNYMIPIFNEIYPNIKVNHTNIIPIEGVIDEYHQKLESALSTGVGIPDVFVEEQSWIKKIIQYDVWENISAAPYNAEEAAADHFRFVKDLARDSDGNLRALSYQACPGGVFYRRSMAIEAFGTDDPSEISALMTDMDAFLEMGRTLKDKGIYLIPGLWDLQRLFFLNKTQPWVVNSKLVIEDVVLDYFDVAKMIRDEGLDAGFTMWAEEWNAAMGADTVFSYVLPTWGLFFILEPSAPQSSGDWAMAHGPYSYEWGGTWIGISKTSEKKDLAWEFVKCMTTNKDLLRKYAKESGWDFTSDAVLDEEISATTSTEFLGGQNHYQYFLDEAQRLSNTDWAARVTQYDEDIQSAFMNALIDYVEGNTTRDEAVESFKDSVVQMYPEISVE